MQLLLPLGHQGFKCSCVVPEEHWLWNQTVRAKANTWDVRIVPPPYVLPFVRVVPRRYILRSKCVGTHSALPGTQQVLCKLLFSLLVRRVAALPGALSGLTICEGHHSPPQVISVSTQFRALCQQSALPCGSPACSPGQSWNPFVASRTVASLKYPSFTASS